MLGVEPAVGLQNPVRLFSKDPDVALAWGREGGGQKTRLNTIWVPVCRP
jgi:hypothetical protein